MKKKYTAKMLKILFFSREAASQNLLLPSLETGYPSKQFKQSMLDLKKTAFIYQVPYLTSNQIGLERSAVVLAQDLKNKIYFDPIYAKFNTYLNPRIVKLSNQTEEDYEQCTSVMGIESKVTRYNDIVITYMTEEGNQKEEEMTGFKSRIFQQAMDTLSGKLPIKWNISKGQNRINENFQNLQNVKILQAALDEYNNSIIKYLESNVVDGEYFVKDINSINIPKEMNNIRFSTKDETYDKIEKHFINEIHALQEELIDFIELNKLPKKRLLK